MVDKGGYKVKGTLRRHGITSGEFADAIDVPPPYLSNIVRGHKDPGEKTLNKIQKGLQALEGPGKSDGPQYAPLVQVLKSVLPKLESIPLHRIDPKPFCKEPEVNGSHEEIVARGERIKAIREAMENGGTPPAPVYVLVDDHGTTRLGADYFLLWGRETFDAARGCRHMVFLPAVCYHVDQSDLAYAEFELPESLDQ